MVGKLLGTAVLGVSLFAAGANAASDTPAVSGATVTTENGVQVIRGSAETYPQCPDIEAVRPAQTINVAVKADLRQRRGLAVFPRFFLR